MAANAGFVVDEKEEKIGKDKETLLKRISDENPIAENIDGFYRPGRLIKVDVKSHHDFGIFLECPEKDPDKLATILAMPHHLEDAENPPAVGSQVEAFVLDVNTTTRLVDVSLLPALINAKKGNAPEERQDSETKKRKRQDLEKNATTLAQGEQVMAQVQLAKMERLIMTVANPLDGGKPAVVYSANPESWNKLQSSAVSMQSGMFALKPVVLQYKIGEKGAKSSSGSEAWIAYNPPVAKKKAVTPAKEPEDAEVSRVAHVSEILAGQTTLKMRVHSVGTTELILRCNPKVWGNLHATELREVLAGEETTREVATKKFREGELLEVRVNKVGKQEARGAGDKVVFGTHLQVSLVKRLSGETEESSKKKRKKKEKNNLAPQTDLKWADLKEKKDERCHGVITSVEKDGLWVELNPSIKGRLWAVDLNLPNTEKSLLDLFVAGQFLPKLYVRSCEKKELDLTVSPPVRIYWRERQQKLQSCWNHHNRANHQSEEGKIEERKCGRRKAAPRTVGPGPHH